MRGPGRESYSLVLSRLEKKIVSRYSFYFIFSEVREAGYDAFEKDIAVVKIFFGQSEAFGDFMIKKFC